MQEVRNTDSYSSQIIQAKKNMSTKDQPVLSTAQKDLLANTHDNDF